MKKSAVFFCAGLFALCFLGKAYSACSQQNLTQCLDSACAINIGINPAARCQLCGSANSGTGATGMTQLTLGAAVKNTLTAAQLKSAPSSPNERYAWAINECTKKIDGCSISDSESYDTLIEQSCRAAGLDIQMSALQESAIQKKDMATCKSEIDLCMRTDKKCGSDFSSCKTDDEFNRIFSECSVAANGCLEFYSDIRTDNLTARDTAIKNAGTIITNIVAKYKTTRENKLKIAKENCIDNYAYNECVETVCAENMKNGCGAEFPNETSMAKQLCQFHITACERLK